jgi:hypothetical protein
VPDVNDNVTERSIVLLTPRRSTSFLEKLTLPEFGVTDSLDDTCWLYACEPGYWLASLILDYMEPEVSWCMTGDDLVSLPNTTVSPRFKGFSLFLSPKIECGEQGLVQIS